MRVVALAGGTGSSKLLRGLQGELEDFTVVANPGDNVWMYGLYICPDIDIAMYTLAGIADWGKGWGIRGDTFNFLEQMASLGEDTWFRLGDRDLATCLLRTRLLKEGKTLTQATNSLRKRLGVKQKVIPPTDDPVETHIVTKGGETHLQEFWVKNRGRPNVEGVKYVGAGLARVTTEVREAILSAERIVICPGNPITSIQPILAVGDLKNSIKRSRSRKVALSPMVGKSSFSGPAPKLMRAVKCEPTSLGVARLYSDFLDEIIIHEDDSDQAEAIEELGIECKKANTIMSDVRDEIRLARSLLRD